MEVYNPARMRLSRTTIGLIVLASLALLLRVWLVGALFAPHAQPIDYEHGPIARNLLAGRGFSIEFLGTEGPTSQQAPFYPFFLAGVYACLGSGTPAAILAVQLIQCLAGTALVLAAVWLAWSLVPDCRAVGWTVGIGAAVYPAHVYMVTHLQVALWAALVLTLLLAVVVSPHWRGTVRGAVLAGVLAGMLLLIEPILALTLPLVALAWWTGERREQRRRWSAMGRLIMLGGVAALLVAPWIVRNARVHGELVFIKSTFGYAFWQGNHPISWGTDKIPDPMSETIRQTHDGTLHGMDEAQWQARHKTLYIDDVLLKPNGYREFAGLSEPERSRLLGRQAWQYILENPVRYAKLCAQRLRYFLLWDETNPKASNWVYRLSTVVWLVLAAVGLMSSWDRWRSLWPSYAIFFAAAAFHSLVIVSARFRIPVEPMTFTWAALAVTPPIVRIASRFVRGKPQPVEEEQTLPAMEDVEVQVHRRAA